MSRAEALATLRALASGLTADHAGVERLLERVVEHDLAAMLRDALVEVGARSVLDSAADPGDVRLSSVEARCS